MPNVRMRGLSLVVSLGLLIGLLAPAVASAKTQLPNYRPVDAPSWVTSPTPDFGHLDSSGGDAAAAAATNRADGDPNYQPGDTVVGINLNEATGYFLATYTVAAIGQHIEVWVQNNLNFPTGDPRNPVVVTQAQIDYLINQFDTNIFPKESEFWRTPVTRDGTNALLPYDYVSPDGQDRVIAMISNVRDAAYYDPTYPNYIAGFFSSTINAYMDRNVITIDSYDWANRVGPNSSPWRPADGAANDRPFLYEGTFAHEYQHLLHGDENPGEESWVNEGLSDWTEYLVGYGIPDSHVADAQNRAENSLVIWEDQGPLEILADYGMAFEFMHYVYSRWGETAMQAIFHDQGFGIAGMNDALASIGAPTFEQVYHEFAVARLVLGRASGPTKGVYNIPDIPTPVQLNAEAYSTPGAPPWGSDYLAFNSKGVKSILFNGSDTLTKATAWTSVADPLGANGQVLWSGTGDEQSRFAIFSTTGGGTLDFDTLYDLEAQWDFGIVQVSTDNGATWTSLSNADTRSDIVPEGYPAIKDNLPGFTGVTGTVAAPAWVHESFDLSSYSGDILVGFRFMSDWGTNGNGALDDPNWYIDNVSVDGSPISDGSDASAFKDITFYQPIDLNFHVDLVSFGPDGQARVFHLVTDSASESTDPVAIRKALSTNKTAVLVVTYDAAQGEADYAPYEVEIIR